MQTQAQAEQGAHVTQEAGKRCCVHVDPLSSDAPLLGFLHGPQQVNAQSLEQEVEAHSEGGQEESNEEVFLHAGTVDPIQPGDSLSY